MSNSTHAIFPDRHVIDVDNCVSFIIGGCFSTIAKQSRASIVIYVHAGNLVISGNIENILVAAHVAIVDVQHRLQAGSSIVDSAILKVDRDILLSSAIVRIDIDNLTGRIKCASVEGHCGRTVCPKRIITARAIKGGVLKCCRSIAPVESLSVNYAIFYNGIICADEAKIIRVSGLECHVLKRNCSCAVKAVISVILRSEISRIRHFCANIPARTVITGSLSDES